MWKKGGENRQTRSSIGMPHSIHTCLPGAVYMCYHRILGYAYIRRHKALLWVFAVSIWFRIIFCMTSLQFNAKSGLLDSATDHLQHPAVYVSNITLAVVTFKYYALPKSNLWFGHYSFEFGVVALDWLPITAGNSNLPNYLIHS